MGILERLGLKKKEQLEKGLEKTRSGFLAKLTRSLVGKDRVDDAVLDELEEILVTSDVGVATTLKIIKQIQARIAREKYFGTAALQQVLREETLSLLKQHEGARPAVFDADHAVKPHVILIVGVNGVGKTTSIGKLASQYKMAGKNVVLGAADTFRAAATEQLEIWAGRAGVPIIKQGQNADPAAVAFDTVTAAKARGADLVLIDTAGRLHNKTQLMEELSKIKRVISKVVDDAPHEVLLVLDASTGQNALAQAKAFTAAVEITGLILTKLDGTAKGGIVLAISNELNVPVKYIGVGEQIDDLQIFDREAFVEAIFGGRNG